MALQISESQKTLFNTIMNNIQPFGYDGDRAIICSGNIPLELCFIDERYQGGRKHTKIARLDKNWDLRKLAPITLVPHYDEYRFAVVDGQGRCIVAPRHGMKSLQAIILMNAPTNPSERLKFEAECFIGQDTETERVIPIEKHTSRIILGDNTAIILDRVLRENEITCIAHKGQRSIKVLGSYTETYRITKSIGEDGLRFIFNIIKAAGWDTAKNGYGREYFRALSKIYSANKSTSGNLVNQLGQVLRQYEPIVFTAIAISHYPNRDRSTAVGLYMADIVRNLQ